MKIGVINYGVGNLASVYRALAELDVEPEIVNHPKDLRAYDRYVLPGVGNFSECAKILVEQGWFDEIKDCVIHNKKPILGICLGMQLLATISHEGAEKNASGVTEGLNLIPGEVTYIGELGCQKPIPHVGWNSVHNIKTKENMFQEIPEGTDFYFVHSYAFVTEEPEHTLASTEYQIEVTAAVAKDHIWGTQFHPEKSSKAGFKILENYIRFCDA